MTENARVVPAYVPPAPAPLRFPANLLTLLRNNVAVVPRQAYEQPVTVVRGPPRMAFFTGPEALERIMLREVDTFPKGRLQNAVLRPLYGDPMFAAEGDDWRWQRAAMAPLFRHKDMVAYDGIFAQAAENRIAVWRNDGSEQPRDIYDDMMHATFEVISGSMLSGGTSRMLDVIARGHAAYFRSINWWIINRMLRLPAWLPRPGMGIMKRHERRFRETVRELVAENVAKGEETNDLIGRLMRARDPQTGRAMGAGEKLVDNIIAFVVAGYDTTALTLVWSLYLLSQSPDWEKALLEEVERVVGDGRVRAQHLPELRLTEQVVRETLRLYPTAPLFLREILSDLDFDGVRIREGTLGVIPIYAIHRHRSCWRDPDVFDPGRFAEDASFKPNRFQYMPFGAGPRICVGAAFAMLEATIMLATFVRAARFRLARDYRPQPVGQLFLAPAGGMRMHVEQRG